MLPPPALPSLRTGLLTLALAALCGCGDPCHDLGDKICACAASPAAQRACRARVAGRAAQWQKDASQAREQAGREVCLQRLEGCSCAALAAGDLRACGLSDDVGSP